MRTLLSILYALARIIQALARVEHRLAHIEQRQETMMGIIEDLDAQVQQLAPAVADLTTAARNLEARIGSLGLTAEQQQLLQGDLAALRTATSQVAEVTSGLNATDQTPPPVAVEPTPAAAPSEGDGATPADSGIVTA